MIRSILDTLRSWWAAVIVFGLALTGEPIDCDEDHEHIPGGFL